MLKRFENVPEMVECCNEAHGEYADGWSFSGNGTCILFSKVTSRPAAPNTTRSHAQTGRVQLWASWPASSPWVTAVGGTRFAAPTAGGESATQVAVDQFGSGGGFSTMYKQRPDATWQAEAVAKYISTVDPSTLPPAGSLGFDPSARGTPVRMQR